MNSLFDEITRVTKLDAYAKTGDERHLKDLPMGFNDPVHLPKPYPMPSEPAPTFDVFDEGLMHDLLGNDNLAKPVAALLQAYEFQWECYTKDDLTAMVKNLRDAVKEEFNNL